VLNCHPKLVAINEKTNHQIVHGRRFGEANGAAHEPLNPGPQIDVFTLDSLYVVFADGVLLGGDMPLVGPSPIGVKPCNTKGFQQTL
jgi:hypothetical protein